jgi:hypothetical protein
MKRMIFCFLAALLLNAESVQPAGAVSREETKSYWTHHHSASVGYRRDRQFFGSAEATQSIHDRNSLELLLGSHLEYNHFLVYLRGGYGWLIDGKIDSAVLGNSFTEPFSFGQYDLGAGYTADVMGGIGLQFTLLDCPNLLIALIPVGGYKYSHLMNFPSGENRSGGQNGFASATYLKPNQQDWYGPFAEARLKFIFLKNYECLFFYQYHRPSIRSKFKQAIDVYSLDPALTELDLFSFSTLYKARSAVKQLGGFEFRYHGASGWNFGAHFEGSAAWSHKAHALSKIEQEPYTLTPTGVTTRSFDERASIHWVCYEASISLGYQF